MVCDLKSAHYVKAFVGIYGAKGTTFGLDDPFGALDPGDRPSSLACRSGNVRLIGTRACTQAFCVDGGELCVKGRPFSLSQPQASVEFRSSGIIGRLADLDGRFAVCAFLDGGLILATDLLGASGIFYCANASSGLVFSTHLGLLLRALPKRPELLDAGVAAMLAGSCSVGGRTAYQGIYRLQAGSFLAAKIENGVISHKVTSYLDVAETLSQPYPAKADADLTFEKLLCASLAREVKSERAGVMLSGGKDSRVLAQGLLLSGARRFPAATFGEWRSQDVRGAKRFATKTGLKHSVTGYRGWTFEDYAPLIVSLGGGMCGFQTAHNLVGFDRARGLMPLGLVGYLGEVLSGVHVRADNRHVPYLPFPFRDRWNPAFAAAYGESLNELIEEVGARADAWPGLSASQRCMLIDILIRQSTWISATFDLCDWYMPLAFPFCSRDLYRFFFSLPFDQLQGQRFYRDWSKKHYRRYAQGVAFPFRWFAYESAQRMLDQVSRRTRFLPIRPLVAWESRFASEAGWLKRMIDGIRDAKLRSVCEGQSFNEREGVPLLLGLALGAAGS